MSSKDTDEGNSKRRRGLGVVTPNACTECRKKRAKCDGQVPCGRCSSQQGIDCVYEMPVRQSKEHMRNELESLRGQIRQSERMVAALVSTSQPELLLRRLRNGDTVEEIVEQLEHQEPKHSEMSNNTTIFSRRSDHDAITSALAPSADLAGWTGGSETWHTIAGLSRNAPGQSTGRLWPEVGSMSYDPSNDIHRDDAMVWNPENVPAGNKGRPLVGTWHQDSAGSSPDSAIQNQRHCGQNFILGHQTNPDTDSSSTGYVGSWTSVTSDNGFVNHIMALYFCWEYPTFASLSKEHFLDAFRGGSQRYCSSLLVNSMLALGCRFSNHPQARTDSKNGNTAGDHFFAEALRLLEAETDQHCLTTVQALGLMSIREASCGRSSDSLYFAGQSIRLAIEMGLHNDLPRPEGSMEAQDDPELAVQAATFWGAFSLDQAWSLTLGHLPQFSRDLQLVAKPKIIEHIESSQWVPYTDDGSPLTLSCIQPSNVRSVYKTFCELSEIVHRSQYTLYTPGTTLTSKTLMDRYQEFIEFHSSLPEPLKLGHNFTPTVIFTHMYYHYAMLLLFRPFIKLDIVGSGVLPRDICFQAAEAVSTLVESYAQLYTLQRTPSFVPYFVLASTMMHGLKVGMLDADSEPLQRGVVFLREMATAHGFASHALKIIRFLLKNWNISVSVNTEVADPEDTNFGWLPSAASTSKFCPSISGTEAINSIGKVAPGADPLFWPFPFQGRPMLDGGPKLETLGFTVLPECVERQDAAQSTAMEGVKTHGTPPNESR